MSASDVDMQDAGAAAPILAEDDVYTWAKASDLALRYIARVRTPSWHAEDVNVDGIGLPAIVRDHEQTIQGPFVNRDAHIPASVRVPETPGYLTMRLCSVATSLSRRPSDYYLPGSDVWHCPHYACDWVIVLDNLTEAQKGMLTRAMGEDTGLFMGDGGNAAAPQPAFVREVVDIVALEHYQRAHFWRLGIRYILHGQRIDGRIAYHWEEPDGGRGPGKPRVRITSAEKHEEKCRVAVQRALSCEARSWATSTIQDVQKIEHALRADASRVQRECALERGAKLINLKVDRVDSLFEHRASLYTDLHHRHSVVMLPEKAMLRVKSAGQKFEDDNTNVRSSCDVRRTAAEEQIEYWTTGEGYLRTQFRPLVRRR
ncbi:unnamed protein product [Peniophora sp. CBMAI 1063]|nr:unnamed protein product [Peniophora sp. CBMAI 1063]